MLFGEMQFKHMNETDVREDIITPLLYKLGYKKGTQFDIIREISLRYPRTIIGRKKKTDPVLRGEADYICDVNNKIRWVIEAKAPNVNFSLNDLEQAYSYAVHQEVRAIYYCLSNGRKMNFYETMKGAIDEPLLSVDYENLTADLQKISNLVSPESLIRDYPDYQIDVGKPLVPGLRSFVKIINGSITYENNSLNLPHLNGMTVTIKGGSAERNEDGGIIAYLETLSPYDGLQKLNEKLGLDNFEVLCEDDELSVQLDKPSIFSNELNVKIPAGEKLLNMLTWQEVVTPMPMNLYTKTTAAGHYDGEKLSGKFQVEIKADTQPSSLVSSGRFEIYFS